MGKPPRDAVRFFLLHSGYMALRLAEAEQVVRKRDDLQYVWQDDPECGPDDFEFDEDKKFVAEHGAVGCILYRICPEHGIDCKHSEQLASLWGITESLNNRERDNYRRVVEAELALEAIDTISAFTQEEQ